MFEEVKEMIDSTVYTNGRGEVTAQNVNLAMHGIVDANEEKFDEVGGELKQTEVKITEIKNDITKLSESGLGGLTLELPFILFQLLELSPEDYILADDTIEMIVAEFPTLAQPIAELMEHNRATLAKINEVLAENKPMPIITIDATALHKDALIAMGEADESILATPFGVNINPSALYYIDYGAGSALTAFLSIEGLSCQVAFTNKISGIVGAMYVSSIYIPRIGEEPTDNSEALYSLDQQYPYSDYLLRNDYFYGNEIKEAIIPVYAKKSDIGNLLFLRFVIGADVVEGVINLETGMTTSRVIATMTAQEVETIAEGLLTSEYNGVSSSGLDFPLNVKANVDWQVVKGEEVISYGAPTGSTSSKVWVTIPANETTEVVNHNYRLIDATTGEELSTIWIQQQAGVETVSEE